MAAKDKENKALELLKQFFKLSKGNQGIVMLNFDKSFIIIKIMGFICKSLSDFLDMVSKWVNLCTKPILCYVYHFILGNYKSKSEFVLTSEIEKEIGPEAPTHLRTKVIKELSEAAISHHVHLEDVSFTYKLGLGR